MLEYTVSKEKGSNQYYVCRVGEEKTPLSKRYTERRKQSDENGIQLVW